MNNFSHVAIASLLQRHLVDEIRLKSCFSILYIHLLQLSVHQLYHSFSGLSRK